MMKNRTKLAQKQLATELETTEMQRNYKALIIHIRYLLIFGLVPNSTPKDSSKEEDCPSLYIEFPRRISY